MNSILLSLVDYLHYLLLILFIIIPIYFPIKLIKKGLYLTPLVICLGWLFFGSCPISKLSNNSKEDFTLSYLKYIWPNATETEACNFGSTMMTLFPTIILYRIFNK